MYVYIYLLYCIIEVQGSLLEGDGSDITSPSNFDVLYSSLRYYL